METITFIQLSDFCGQMQGMTPSLLAAKIGNHAQILLGLKRDFSATQAKRLVAEITMLALALAEIGDGHGQYLATLGSSLDELATNPKRPAATTKPLVEVVGVELRAIERVREKGSIYNAPALATAIISVARAAGISPSELQEATQELLNITDNHIETDMKKKSIYLSQATIAKLQSLNQSLSFNKAIESMALLGFELRKGGLETVKHAELSRNQIIDLVAAHNGVDLQLKFPEMMIANLEDYYLYNESESTEAERQGLIETLTFWKQEDGITAAILANEVRLFWEAGEDLDAFISRMSKGSDADDN